MIGSPNVTGIRRIHRPSVEEFRREFLVPGIPAILTGVTADWPAAQWSVEHFETVMGDVKLAVQKRPDGNGTPGERTDSLSMREYVRLITSDRPDRKHFYYTTSRVVPEFARDLGSIPYALGDNRSPSLFFMGCESFTRLHYHPEGDAFTCQFIGSKRFVLYPPDQSRFLYVVPLSPTSRALDPEKADRDLYPAFSKARAIECVLQPGEVMFIPIHWWHVVYGSEFNVSVLYPSVVTDWRRVWFPPIGWRGTTCVAARNIGGLLGTRPVVKLRETFRRIASRSRP